MTDCPICLETIDSNFNKVTTECGHTFHCGCLMKNVSINGFGCPSCRTAMTVQSSNDDANDDDTDDNISISSQDIREDNILTAFRWFQRRLYEVPEPISRNGVITYEIQVDDDGYYYESEFHYWDQCNTYMHPPYLFYKLSNDGLYDDRSVSYTDLALAYMSLKRKYDGDIQLREGDYSYNKIDGNRIPSYEGCEVYAVAEAKVNNLIDKAITDYYINEQLNNTL